MARLNFKEAVDLLRQAGDNLSLAWALSELGHVLLMQGELDQAGIYLLEGLTTANGLGNHGILVIALVGTAVLIARQSKDLPDALQQDNSKLALAARICGSTVPFIGAPGIFVWADTKTLYETAIKQVKSSMSSGLWEQAYHEGQSMPIDQSVALVTQALKD